MKVKPEVSAKTAELLLQIKAIILQPQNPFTWSSGMRSPIYCDNRKILSYPTARDYIRDSLTTLIKEQYKDEVDVIAGVATSGIAFGALVANKMELPMIYVRPQPKSHGLGRQIEGDLLPKQKVVVIEDLLSTGQSSLNVVKSIRDTGCEVLGVVAIFSYGFDATRKLFEELSCDHHTLTNYDELIEAAVQDQYVSEQDMASLNNWRQDPGNWGK